MITKQVTGDQFPPTTNGRLVHDSSDVSMNGMLRGTSRPAQGVPKGPMYSQEQGQALRSLGLSPQWLDASVYGTPTARRQSSYPQWVSGNSATLLTIASFNQAQMPFSNFSSGDQEDFASKQGFQKRNSFAQVPPQVLYNGDIPGNFEQLSFARSNASVQETDGMHGGGEKTTRVGYSEGLVALDAMEKKILFSMDENILDASFGRRGNIGAGRFGNTLEHLDYHSNVSSYSQSGSYSALLQSAVAEASSSDSDLQGWSGLTFQNTGLSNENQPSNFVENYTGQVSDSVMGLEKEELPGFQDNLMEVASRGNVGSNTYAAGGKLDSFSGCGLTTQTRQAKEGSTFPHILSKVPKEQKSDASLAQADNQSYASQQCGLRLAPQSQQLPNSSHLDAAQGVPKTEHQFPHPTLPGLVGRLPPFNLPLPRDASQPILGQQFPIWEALHTTQPSDMLQISRQTGSLVKPPDILTNILPSQQHLSAEELQRGPSIDLSNNSLETSSLIQRELKNQNLPKDEYESSSGADFMNSKGYDYQEEKPAIGRSHHLALPETDTQTGNSIQRKESAASLLETHLHEQDFGKLHYSSHQDVHPSLSGFKCTRCASFASGAFES